MSQNLKLQVKKLSEHASLPMRGSAAAAGYDLCRYVWLSCACLFVQLFCSCYQWESQNFVCLFVYFVVVINKRCKQTLSDQSKKNLKKNLLSKWVKT